MTNIRKSLNKKRGFTLIELLVVVAIVTMISSILLSSVSKYRARAHYTRAGIDIRTMQHLIESYYNDTGDWPPKGERYMARTNPPAPNPTPSPTPSPTPFTTYVWDDLANKLKPYAAQLPYPTYNTGYFVGEYTYFKGTNEGPIKLKILDFDGNAISCLFINHGYYMNFYWNDPIPLSTQDGGVDPFAVEVMQGNVEVRTNLSDCPSNSAVL